MTFRLWLQERWYQHLQELEEWGQTAPAGYTVKQYLAKYRWWLRREYRFQKSNT